MGPMRCILFTRRQVAEMRPRAFRSSWHRLAIADLLGTISPLDSHRAENDYCNGTAATMFGTVAPLVVLHYLSLLIL